MNVSSPKSLTAALDALPDKERARLEKSVGEFESMFYKQLFGVMRESVQEDPLFNGGQGEKMFKDLLDNEYARMASERPQGSGGLKEVLMNQLLGRYQAPHPGLTGTSPAQQAEQRLDAAKQLSQAPEMPINTP